MMITDIIICSTKLSAEIEYRVQMEAIKCNTEVAMETVGEVRNLKIKSKMAESKFASSDEINVDPTEIKCKKTKRY